MIPDDAIRAEIAHNFDYFQRTLAEHLARHAGQFALIRSQRVIEYFCDPFDAELRGARIFGDGLYSIQQVTAEPIELGMYANAIG